MSGMFGAVCHQDCVETLFYGIDYHTHLGTEYAGMAVLNDAFVRQIHSISQSQFKSKFSSEYQHFAGTMGIGVISSLDEQPIYFNSKFGELCIATDGYIENAAGLADRLKPHGISFAEFSPRGINGTELIGKLIVQEETLTDGIRRMYEQIEGSTSLLILSRNGIYAARDRLGYTPLAIGQRDGDLAVTTETSAFVNNGFTLVRHLEPGEIVLLRQEGVQQVKKPGTAKQVCSFLWIYTGFPASSFDGRSVEAVRQECGRHLARYDRDIDVDLVCGVPDSGIGHAIGYSIESGRPYMRPLVKYTPGYGRSYTPPSQQTRDMVARMKLIPVRELIEGKRIVVCDDSIVRGTQLKNFTVRKLWDSGAREVHVRIACPPLMFPCKFIFSTRSIDELAARRAIRNLEGGEPSDLRAYIDPTTPQYHAMVQHLAEELEVTSLRFLNVSDMFESIGLPAGDLCQYCWTGRVPPAQK